MERSKHVKHFLDSVHGTIDIPKEYCDRIIDTCYFQRLRRIEQNSCRSVFPSARHDRFIHSIGVYYLGNRIANNIKEKFFEKEIIPKNFDIIIKTYEVACLLHDIGHTPFSHTFEDFFDKEKAENALIEKLNDECFTNDVNNGRKAASHEIISAYVAINVFNEVLKDFGVDLVLLARMITGYRFLSNEKKPIKSFENAMIELIHGDIIDADGLDYVCRDVWAGGYKNFTIDLNRLISSIEIEYNSTTNEYSVIYSSKALNEIEAVLNIKNFQYLYVLKHHKVLLEQYLLVEAMKSAACYHLRLPNNTPDERDNALRVLCDYKSFIEKKELPELKYKLYRPADDDFVALMKLYDPDEFYIRQWLSRKYNATSLWKSKLEYFNIFRPVFETLSNDVIERIYTLLVSDTCKHYLCANYNLDERDIIVIGVEPKIRSLDAEKIHVRLNDSIQPYSKLNHDVFSVISKNLPYCYMYIDLEKIGKEDKTSHIKNIIHELKNFLVRELRHLWD